MKIHFLFVVVAAAVLLIASCKKDNPSTGSYKLEYRIGEADNYITEVTYTDSSGTTRTATQISEFNNGDTTLTVTRKPFIATLFMQVNNTDNVAHTYTMAILLNGQVEKYQGVSVQPFSTFTAMVSDTVQ